MSGQGSGIWSHYLGWGLEVLLYAGETQDLWRTDGDARVYECAGHSGVSMVTVHLS